VHVLVFIVDSKRSRMTVQGSQADRDIMAGRGAFGRTSGASSAGCVGLIRAATATCIHEFDSWSAGGPYDRAAVGLRMMCRQHVHGPAWRRS